MDDRDHFPDPKAVVPTYEQDDSASGANREVHPDLADEVPWTEVHGITDRDLADLQALGVLEQ